MPGLVPGIHVLFANDIFKTWMAATSAAMTNEDLVETKWHVIINIAINPQEARNVSSASAN